MLSDKDDFLHAVAIRRVPVAEQARFLFHQFDELFFRSGGVPLAGFGKVFLCACLLEEVRHVGIVLEIADAFGADDVRAPMLLEKIIELVEVESGTTVIDKRTDAVF